MSVEPTSGTIDTSVPVHSLQRRARGTVITALCRSNKLKGRGILYLDLRVQPTVSSQVLLSREVAKQSNIGYLFYCQVTVKIRKMGYGLLLSSNTKKTSKLKKH